MKPLTTPCKLLAAASLSLLAVAAQAGGLSLQDSFQIANAGDFSRSLTLQLDQRSQVSLWLQGWSQKGNLAGGANGALASSDLSIRGLSLQKGGTTLVFDGLPGHGSLGEASWSSEARSNPGSNRSWTAYLQTYELQPLVLEAGTWTVSYYGHDEHKKFASGVELRVQAQNAVPEPAALSLAGLSLALVGLLSRRRRA